MTARAALLAILAAVLTAGPIPGRPRAQQADSPAAAAPASAPATAPPAAAAPPTAAPPSAAPGPSAGAAEAQSAPASPAPPPRRRPRRRVARPAPPPPPPTDPPPLATPRFEPAPMPNRSVEAPRIAPDENPSFSPSIIHRAMPNSGAAREGARNYDEERLFFPAPGARLTVPFSY